MPAPAPVAIGPGHDGGLGRSGPSAFGAGPSVHSGDPAGMIQALRKSGRGGGSAVSFLFSTHTGKLTYRLKAVGIGDAACDVRTVPPPRRSPRRRPARSNTKRAASATCPIPIFSSAVTRRLRSTLGRSGTSPGYGAGADRRTEGRSLVRRTARAACRHEIYQPPRGFWWARLAQEAYFPRDRDGHRAPTPAADIIGAVPCDGRAPGAGIDRPPIG